MLWSCSKGIREYSGKVVDSNTRDLGQAMDFIAQRATPSPYWGTAFILQDPHIHFSPLVARLIRDMYIPLQSGQPASQKKEIQKSTTVFMVSGRVGHIANGFTEGLEPSVANLIDIIDLPLPTKTELSIFVRNATNEAKKNPKSKVKVDYSAEHIDSFAGALQGLTLLEGIRSVAECFHLKGQIELTELQEKKRQIVKQDGLLEVVENLPDMEQVGGLDEVKRFINTYSGQFSERAAEFGLEPLKAVLLLGIPGTGKSLVAKAVAALWQLPCIRLDMGKVFSGVVGSSESNIRRGIKTIEAAAPTTLWVDEIEKQMSGTASSNFSDSGTTSRVFGTLLTAMEEGMKNVCVVATANDITALPPELIRRFDETFWVDLPVQEERAEILRIHLSKRKRDPSLFSLGDIVKNTYGFTGSEIEKVVKVGIANAFHLNEELKEEHILSAIKDTKPLSKTMAQQIETSRKWAKGRARRASSLLLDEDRAVKIEDALPSLEEVTSGLMTNNDEGGMN